MKTIITFMVITALFFTNMQICIVEAASKPKEPKTALCISNGNLAQKYYELYYKEYPLSGDFSACVAKLSWSAAKNVSGYQVRINYGKSEDKVFNDINLLVNIKKKNGKYYYESVIKNKDDSFDYSEKMIASSLKNVVKKGKSHKKFKSKKLQFYSISINGSSYMIFIKNAYIRSYTLVNGKKVWSKKKKIKMSTK